MESRKIYSYFENERQLEGKICVPEEPISDFSRELNVKPLIIVSPDCVEDISLTLRIANELKLPVAIRGSAHTTGGQTLVEGGVVINMQSLSGETVIIESNGEFFLETRAGNMWHDVIQETLSQNLVPPVYSDWLYLTVGGTLSTGGVGQTSFRKGLQVDNVVSLEVVMPNGERMSLTSYENVDLFHSIRGGLGLFGIITKVTMKLEQAPQNVVVVKVLFDSLEHFVTALGEVINNNYFDGVQSHVEPSIFERVCKRFGGEVDEQMVANNDRLFVLELTKYLYGSCDHSISDYRENLKALLDSLNINYSDIYIYTNEFLSHISRVPPILDPDLEHDNPGHNHACFFVSLDAAADVLREQYENYSIEDEGYGATLIIPFKKSCVGALHSVMLPDSEDIIFIGFLRRVVPYLNNNQKLNEMNKEARSGVLSRHGTQYLCDSLTPYVFHEFDVSFWRSHFDVLYLGRENIKRQHDENNILGRQMDFVGDNGYEKGSNERGVSYK